MTTFYLGFRIDLQSDIQGTFHMIVKTEVLVWGEKYMGKIEIICVFRLNLIENIMYSSESKGPLPSLSRGVLASPLFFFWHLCYYGYFPRHSFAGLGISPPFSHPFHSLFFLYYYNCIVLKQQL